MSGGVSPWPAVHHRQVVIGPEPFAARPDWLTERLDSATFVSHCPALRNGTATDSDGGKWMLLGLAVQTLSEAPGPLGAIASAGTSDVPDVHGSWAGRWLLVGDGAIHLDAAGLLGCIYGTDARGRTWASSSPALLAEIVAPSEATVTSIDLPEAPRISWYPPPRTRFDGVRRLHPSQVLSLSDGTTSPRPLLPAIKPDREYDETLELLGGALVEGMRRLPATPRPVALALTAGLDSRTVLAAAERAGIDYQPFVHISAWTTPADRLLSAQLSEAVGRKIDVHRRSRLRTRRTRRERIPAVLEHTAGHVPENDCQVVLRGVRDSIAGISAGGWAFEVGHASHWEGLPLTFTEPSEGAEICARSCSEPAGSPAIDGLREWLEWAVRTPQDHLDLRDRFYLEQRMAGRKSSREQLHDMVALERYPVINCARTYALMVGIDRPRRAVKQHQQDLIERLCPQLAGFPANPPVEELPLGRVVATTLRDDPVGLAREGWKRVRRR